MRSIFFRLILSFSLTILLSGLISALVLFSFSRRSVESFRHDFFRQLQTNIARSVVLMGQAAYVMHQHRGDRAFEEYIREILNSMHTRLYLCIDDRIMPKDADSDQRIARLAATAGATDQPTIEDTGKELIVIQRLFTPEGQSYVVVGLHQFKPPPAWDGGPPPPNGPAPGGMGPPPPGPNLGFPPPPGQNGFLALFRNGPELQTLVLLLIAGIVCFQLARSFSAPLARLRSVSRQIADGDLTARIGTSLGKPGNEIGDLARDFDHMAERMAGLVNAQKRLLLDISHELRSPLTRLNIALELAKKRFQAEEDDNLGRIARESERLNHLIGQLLTLTRSEGYASDAQESPVLLADLVLEIAEDVDFETKPLTKGVAIMELEPLTVVGSRELLRQAIENVVRNGAYYTRCDSRVEVYLFSCVSSELGKPAAVIRIRDHGPGVPAEQLPHLTEPFYRVAEARDRNSGGTGLGLSITQHAVHQHGGALVLTNGPEHDGLIVEIHLPLRVSASPNPDSAPV
jgi:two-component system sensor histidine kinase CpxA